MTQFEMPIGSRKGKHKFQSLSSFAQAYVEAMFWTDCTSDNPELENMTFDDLSQDALRKIVKDCRRFKAENSVLLDAVYMRDGYSEEQAGHDFWLTRNHHGAGFWGRSLGEAGEQLTRAAHGFGEVSPYAGGDGRMYLD